jgi:P-type conjugative transfer protein TrbJ
MTKRFTQSIISGVLVITLSLGNAQAGTVAGTGGSTEITQILNNLQLIQSYEKMVDGYARQGQQLESQLKNLMANPASVLPSDVQQLISGISTVMSGGQAIGYNLAQIDTNFAKLYKGASMAKSAAQLGAQLTAWHQANTDTMEGVLKSIGTMRSQYSSNQSALTALYNQSQATNGTLDSLQTLSQINIKQVQSMDALKELMATQASAETTYMASQTAKQEQDNQNTQGLIQNFTPKTTTLTTGAAPKW